MNLQEIIEKELYQVIKQKYENKLYSDAIIDSIKYLTTLIREKSKVDGDGASLIGQAFGGQSPEIKLNKMLTNSEIDEQKGFEQILRGIYSGIRNPRTHEQYQDKKKDADSIILFIDYLIRVIKTTKSYFEIDEFKNRVFDPLFVARNDYAEMLVNEIPYDEIVDTSISILKDRNRGEPIKLDYFFKALFNVLDKNKQEILIKAFSNELKCINSEYEIIGLVRLIQPKYWAMLDNYIKIRIENTMIKSVSEATYEMYSGDITKGSLGTWASRRGEYFSLRRELGQAIISQLGKNWYTQNYIAEYFIYNLSSIIQDEDLIRECANNLAYATMDNNAKHLRTRLEENFTFFPAKWRELILKYSLKYKDSDPEYFELLLKRNEDGIPF